MIYISLGSNCYVSWTLRKIKLQEKSYPWDWINSPNFSHVIHSMENGFSDIIKQSIKSNLIEDAVENNVLLSVTHDFRFPHEYDVNKFNNINDIVARYDRRLNRFYNAIKSDLRIIFLRVAESGYRKYVPESESIYLDNLNLFQKLIENINPSLDYRIVLLSKKYMFTDKVVLNDKIMYFNNCIPFENCFYSYNTDCIQGDSAINHYNDFFANIRNNW